jgi:hypothetical protein
MHAKPNKSIKHYTLYIFSHASHDTIVVNCRASIEKKKILAFKLFLKCWKSAITKTKFNRNRLDTFENVSNNFNRYVTNLRLLTC